MWETKKSPGIGQQKLAFGGGGGEGAPVGVDKLLMSISDFEFWA